MSIEVSLQNELGDALNTQISFVTGSTGLLGSHVIKALLKQNKKVKAVYRNTIPCFEGSEKVEWCKGDILDPSFLEEEMLNVHTVYHCAAIVSFNPKNKRDLYKINVEGTANVVNAALECGVKRFCHVSSVASLGKPTAIEIDETNEWNDTDIKSNYAKSKYLGELEVWRGISEGLQAVIINPSIILGAGNWDSGSTKIFQTAYNEFPWYTEGVTGFVDVHDVVKAMILLTQSDISNERFIVSAENKTYKSVFSCIATCFGKKTPSKRVTPLLAGIIRRIEDVKSIFSNKEPLLTKETAEAALTSIFYKNDKLLKYFPTFSYTPVEQTIERICTELKKKHSLS